MGKYACVGLNWFQNGNKVGLTNGLGQNCGYCKNKFLKIPELTK